jgi:hypothetical protein
MAGIYKLCGDVYQFEGPDDDDRLQEVLQRHYHDFKGVKPQCLCRDEMPLPLYIARLGETYVLKRWPDSGSKHHHRCDRYEAPPEASGMGALSHAMNEDPATGMTALKLGFALKKLNKGPIDAAATKPLDERADDAGKTKVEERRFSLKSVIHYLWEKSELNRWHPGMKGRRSWRTVHNLTTGVASATLVGGRPMSEHLYVPPLWSNEEGKQYESLRRHKIGTFMTRSGPKRLLMILAEIKAFETSQFGYKIVLKSMADTKIYASEDMMKVMSKRFEFEIGSWNEDSSKLHLVSLLVVSVSNTGSCQVVDMALMLTNKNWLPIFNYHDGMMVAWADETNRSFVKPLTFNLGRGRTVASIILLDTKPLQVNVFVTQPDESEVLQESREQLIAASKGHSIVWNHEEDLDMDDMLAKVPAFEETSNA